MSKSATASRTSGALHVEHGRETAQAKKAARLTRRRLAAVAGPEVADRILAEWSGHRLPEAPDADELARRERDRRIREELNERGAESYREIGRRYGLSPSRVAQIGKETD